MAILPYPADSAAPPSPGALGNADGCPSCVMNVEPPRSVVEIADGHRCAYLCSDCGHAWTTDWRD